jgi:uncharacterized protein YkwD
MWVFISILTLIIGLGVGVYVIPQLSNRGGQTASENNAVQQIAARVNTVLATPSPTRSVTKTPTEMPSPTPVAFTRPSSIPESTLTAPQILALIDSGKMAKEEGIRILEGRKPSATLTPTKMPIPASANDPERGSIEWVNTLETSIGALINNERQGERLPTLAPDVRLTSIARAHSQDMAAHAYFDHTNRNGETPTDRANQADYSCRKNLGGSWYSDGIAENIFQAWTYSSSTVFYGITSYNYMTIDAIAKQVVQGWMDSPGHRENILEKQYDKSGIGIAVNNDMVYVTQNFC